MTREDDLPPGAAIIMALAGVCLIVAFLGGVLVGAAAPVVAAGFLRPLERPQVVAGGAPGTRR
jgi:hypothetical protein